ncbi:unnamed protein product, partial [Ectocarpus sp. 12 AP-2014]
MKQIKQPMCTSPQGLAYTVHPLRTLVQCDHKFPPEIPVDNMDQQPYTAIHLKGGLDSGHALPGGILLRH